MIHFAPSLTTFLLLPKGIRVVSVAAGKAESAAKVCEDTKARKYRSV